MQEWRFEVFILLENKLWNPESCVGDRTFVCPRSEFLSRPLLWAFTETDHAELRDIVEAREFLEQDLAGLVAQRATDSELQAIGSALKKLRKSIAKGAMLEAAMEFHLAIAQAAHNEVSRNAVQLLRNLLRKWLVLKLLIPQVPAKVLKQLEAIYKGIRAADSEEARKAMWAHLEETARLITDVVQKKSSRESRNGRSKSKRYSTTTSS